MDEKLEKKLEEEKKAEEKEKKLEILPYNMDSYPLYGDEEWINYYCNRLRTRRR